MAPRPVGSDALGLSSVPGLAVYCRCPLKKQSEGRESFVSVQRDKDQEIVCKARVRSRVYYLPCPLVNTTARSVVPVRREFWRLEALCLS